MMKMFKICVCEISTITELALCVLKCLMVLISGDFRVVLFNMVPLSIINTLICIAGIAIYAYYVVVQCDPLESGQVTSPNQVKVTQYAKIWCKTSVLRSKLNTILTAFASAPHIIFKSKIR